VSGIGRSTLLNSLEKGVASTSNKGRIYKKKAWSIILARWDGHWGVNNKSSTKKQRSISKCVVGKNPEKKQTQCRKKKEEGGGTQYNKLGGSRTTGGFASITNIQRGA